VSDWERTLQRLGLDPNAGREEQMEEMQKEWDGILLDSVKRKRRKKMRKHM
jgi:hypothetical protein